MTRIRFGGCDLSPGEARWNHGRAPLVTASNLARLDQERRVQALTDRSRAAATTRWSASCCRPSEQLAPQPSAGLAAGARVLGAGLTHHPAEDLGATYPHAAVGIGDGHPRQLQQHAAGSICACSARAERMLQRTSHWSSRYERLPQQGPGPLHPVTGQGVGGFGPHVGILVTAGAPSARACQPASLRFTPRPAQLMRADDEGLLLQAQQQQGNGLLRLQLAAAPPGPAAPGQDRPRRSPAESPRGQGRLGWRFRVVHGDQVGSFTLPRCCPAITRPAGRWRSAAQQPPAGPPPPGPAQATAHQQAGADHQGRHRLQAAGCPGGRPCSPAPAGSAAGPKGPAAVLRAGRDRLKPGAPSRAAG